MLLNRRFILYVVLASLVYTTLLGCTTNTLRLTILPADYQQGRQIIPLSGKWKFKPGNSESTNLYFTQIDDSSWKDIKVPSNWYLEGYDISGVAWYRKHFTLPKQLKGKHLTLLFEGVDYSADIWLNGRYIGFHQGYFQPFKFDVTDAVLWGKENILTVKVDSPLEASGQDWSLHKRLIKGIFGHHDTRPGGAWSDRAQEKNTGGIWAPVSLLVHGSAFIDQVKVTPKLDLSRDQATAEVAFEVDLKQKTPLEVKVESTLMPYNFSSSEGITQIRQKVLQPGLNLVTSKLTMEHPRLWWPWEHGDANLYTLIVTLKQDGHIIDRKFTTFGFRQVRYDQKDKVWRINGKRMFLRGTNYIATQWLSEMSPARFDFDIGLMKHANINIVRVHAHVTAESFYRLCDEAGLLVWQDFPLQWGYSDDKEVQESAVSQVKDMINGLYNHPSIIAWSLHNEPPWDANWMKYKYKSYDPEQNRELTDKLYEAAEPLDKTRYLHAYSATAEHPWLGWYSGSWLDYIKPTRLPIIAEFGAQALPEINSLRRIFNEDELWPKTEEQWKKWEYHNFQRHETFNNAQIEMGETPEEFINNTQQYQAKLIKLAAESYRRQRYKPVNSIFQFMFVEDWPSMNWGVVDYWRNPKRGYYALQQAYQPVLPSIAWEKETFSTGEKVVFKLWAINDLWRSFPSSRITYSLRNRQGVLETGSLNINLDADSIQHIEDLQWDHLAKGHYQLIMKISDRNGTSLGINTHEFDVVN